LFKNALVIFTLSANLSAPALAAVVNNGGFEQVNAQGSPTGWWCNCQAGISPQCTIEHSLVHSGNDAFNIPPGCWAATMITPNPTNDGFRFELFAHGKDLKSHEFIIRGLSADKQETSYSKIISANIGEWSLVKSEAISSLSSIWGGEVIINNTSDSPIIIDDVAGFQDLPNPATKVGDIIRLKHRSVLQATGAADVLWVPLPMDYAAQTPLYLDLKVSPHAAVESLQYSQDKFGNWGALANFTSYSGTVHLDWDGLMLTRDIPGSEHGQVYAATEDPNLWMGSTPVVNSNFPALSTVVNSITQGAQTPGDKIMKILGWLSKNVTYGYDNIGLDSTHVFQDHLGTCTGYANLAAAMGRAAGIPTRTIPNILVGSALNTHYINEFYLGPRAGWWRIEPQSLNPNVSSDYGIVMRLTEPTDEGQDAYAGTSFGAPGVPFWSILQSTTVNSGLNQLDPNHFKYCPYCDNEATHVVDLRTDLVRFKRSFLRARGLWQQDLSRYLNGTMDSQRILLRESAKFIQDEADLESFLDTLSF